MDFRELVGSNIHITALVKKIVVDRTSNVEMILLNDVYINGEYFRNHAWVKMTKRLSSVSAGVNISASAKLIEYFGCDGKGDKLGFRSIRSVKIL